MFQYEVLTEEVAMQERFQLLKEGEYDAVVQTAIDKVSASSGNPMIDLTLSVYDAEGNTHSVRDFLVFTKSMMWKVIHCASSAGVMMQYTAGRMCSDLMIGKRLRVKVGVEEGKEISADKLNGKPVGSKYPSKNKVEDYIKCDSQAPINHSIPDDEDVPF
jgi:hypothetical protein